MRIILLQILKIILFLALVISLLTAAQETLALIVNNKYIARILSELFTAGLTLLVFYLFTRYWEETRLKETAVFPKSGSVKYLLSGAALGAIMLILTFIISKYSGAIDVTIAERDKTTILVNLLISFAAMAFAAFWEELAFRGFVLVQIEKMTGKHLACFIVALAFGLLHLLSPIKSWQIVLSTFLSGLLLSYSFVLTRNLYFPIGIHFMWNFLNNAIFSGSTFSITYYNQFWGGIKNPEEGMIAIIVTIIGLLMVIFIFQTTVRFQKYNVQ